MLFPTAESRCFLSRPRGDERCFRYSALSFGAPMCYVARLDHPVKNHVRLIDALQYLKKKLIIHTALFWQVAVTAGKIKKYAASSKYSHDIFTGHFPRQSLPELYGGRFCGSASLYGRDGVLEQWQAVCRSAVQILHPCPR